jgi:hypothetical protein
MPRQKVKSKVAAQVESQKLIERRAGSKPSSRRIKTS